MFRVLKAIVSNTLSLSCSSFFLVVLGGKVNSVYIYIHIYIIFYIYNILYIHKYYYVLIQVNLNYLQLFGKNVITGFPILYEILMYHLILILFESFV